MGLVRCPVPPDPRGTCQVIPSVHVRVPPVARKYPLPASVVFRLPYQSPEGWRRNSRTKAQRLKSKESPTGASSSLSGCLGRPPCAWDSIPATRPPMVQVPTLQPRGSFGCGPSPHCLSNPGSERDEASNPNDSSGACCAGPATSGAAHSATKALTIISFIFLLVDSGIVSKPWLCAL